MGGNLAELHANRDKVLAELWTWMQDLDIPESKW